MKINEMMKEALEYIEKESVDWDAADLGTGGLFQVFQYIQEAVCKALFIHMHREMEDLPEEFLKEESIYFYYDCIQVMHAKYIYVDDRVTGSGGIDYRKFHKQFVKFIECVQQMKVSKDMGKEINQLYQLLDGVTFKEEDSSKDRYVNNEYGNIDIQNQIKRFWSKWIVGDEFLDISRERLLSKNMKEEELIFWLLIESILNFTYKCDGEKDLEMEELKKCFAYKRDTKKEDISDALKWCFRCWFQLIMYGEENLREITQHPNVMHGVAGLADRYGYQKLIIKRHLRRELEELFDHPKKVFTTRYANSLVSVIEFDSLKTPMPLVGDMTSTGFASTDVRYTVRHLRDIWKDFDDKWFSSKAYIEAHYGKEADVPQVELEICDQDMQVNKFFAYEFIKLLNLQCYDFTYLLLAEKHLLFSQLEDLMFRGELSLKEICLGIVALALLKEGKGTVAFEEDKVENDEEESDEGFNITKRLREQERRMFELYGKVFEDELEAVECYCRIVMNIVGQKKVKVSQTLLKEFSREIKQDGFCIDEDGYISWEAISQSGIEESFILSICYAAMSSYCTDLEYSL